MKTILVLIILFAAACTPVSLPAEVPPTDFDTVIEQGIQSDADIENYFRALLFAGSQGGQGFPVIQKHLRYITVDADGGKLTFTHSDWTAITSSDEFMEFCMQLLFLAANVSVTQNKGFELTEIYVIVPTIEGDTGLSLTGRENIQTVAHDVGQLTELMEPYMTEIEQPVTATPQQRGATLPSITEGCPTGCTYHPPGCDIKGNISFTTREKIFHVPGQEYYEETVIDPAYGERWFCTEAEARANGWRKALN